MPSDMMASLTNLALPALVSEWLLIGTSATSFTHLIHPLMVKSPENLSLMSIRFNSSIGVFMNGTDGMS